MEQSLATIAGFPLNESIVTNTRHILSSQGLAQLNRFLLGFSKIGTFARLQLPVKVACCETQEKSKVEDPWSCLLTIKTDSSSVLVAKNNS